MNPFKYLFCLRPSTRRTYDSDLSRKAYYPSDEDAVQARENLKRGSRRYQSFELTMNATPGSPRPVPAQQAPNASTIQEMGDEDPATVDQPPVTFDPTQDPTLPDGLREISSLAHWEVNSQKPGCGVEALLSHSPSHFWQSDGPQPHLITIHFARLVAIVKLRVYLDYVLDESYTPTRMSFWAGSSIHDLVQFSEWRGLEPRGWIDVALDGVGVDANAALRAFVVQIQVMENHQNGKDTHVRAVQVFAKGERPQRYKLPDRSPKQVTEEGEEEHPGLTEPDFMAEPEIR